MGHIIQRYHDISCGHRVHGHESKCAHLHGHNYRITFTCAATPGPQTDPFAVNRMLDHLGRVIDFSVVKQQLCEWVEMFWDHKFLVWDQDPARQALLDIDPPGVVWVSFNPTAENMAQFLVDVIGPHQLAGTGVTLVECKVEETRKCSATYVKPDEIVVSAPAAPEGSWAGRKFLGKEPQA